jgi:RNA polymerase sigma-70 factor (ECF subfamily)
MNQHSSDEEIVAIVKKGNTEAFGELIERYEPKLLRYGKKFLSTEEDIEDIVQDVFISAYRNIQSVDTSLKFSPWIYRIAHNAFVNALRKKSRNPLTLVDFDVFIGHPVYEDPDVLEKEQEEIKDKIHRGLAELVPKYREVLILHYLEELSYKEISEVLQVPMGTIGIRMMRAREALKKVYVTREKALERKSI